MTQMSSAVVAASPASYLRVTAAPSMVTWPSGVTIAMLRELRMHHTMPFSSLSCHSEGGLWLMSSVSGPSRRYMPSIRLMRVVPESPVLTWPLTSQVSPGEASLKGSVAVARACTTPLKSRSVPRRGKVQAGVGVLGEQAASPLRAMTSNMPNELATRMCDLASFIIRPLAARGAARLLLSDHQW